MDDDDPDTEETPRHDSASRRPRARTVPGGVPSLVIDRPSRAVLQAALDEVAPPAPLGRAEVVAIVDAQLKEETARRFRRLWGGLGAVAGSALVALVAAIRGWQSDARTQGADQLRIQVIERDLDRLRAETEALRTVLYRGARRDDQPDPPPITAASKRILP